MLNNKKYPKRKSIAGFTLTELMVALAVNAILFIAFIGIFITNLEHYRKTLNANRLQSQLQSAMDIMGNDIRRAGYWANSRNDIGTGANTNPYMNSGMDITTYNSNTCILFSYDHDNSGALPSSSNSYDDERYGYRLSNQAIQTKPWGAAYDCNATDWENMTDPTIIRVTQLTFVLTQQAALVDGTKGMTVRSVDITLTGQLVSDASVTKTLTQHIRVQNDKFTP
jgi:prepilin peptidase dependent protein B